MLKRCLVLTCLLIASALTLAACGSGDNDESQIEDAVETSATSNDPADCKKLSTQQFMEQTTKSSGSEAVESCEEQASKDEGVETATVSSVEVDGSKATAETTLGGGTFDGQQVEVALVKEGDQWKLDKITRFTKFDKAKVIGTFEKEFDDPSSGLKRGTATCIIDSFEAAPQAEFEEALLGPTNEGFEEIAGHCL